MKTYNDLINEYRGAFNDDVNTLRAFLFELCNEKNINLYMEKDNEADKEVVDKFEKGVKRLLNDEPLNYVLGYSYFYGYKMIVDGDVLIPRFETEELVGLVLSYIDEKYKNQNDLILADIGTGSGAIAIALKKEEPKLKVYASDISKEALEVAKKNAKENNCEINFLQGSMLDPLIENNIKLDILVSNPPYIKEDEILDASVKDYEPHVALFGGKDGLKFYRGLTKHWVKRLVDGGMMAVEIGEDQGDDVSRLFVEAGLSDVRVYKDASGLDRVVTGILCP